MLIPSYGTLIQILNQDANVDQRIASRYSIVIAAAKRARQIVGGAEYDDFGANTDKAVSIAVNEIQMGYVKIAPGSVDSWNMPPIEQVLQNFPTVIDEGFVQSEDGLGLETYEESGFDGEDYEADFDESWDEADEVLQDFDDEDDEVYEDED